MIILGERLLLATGLVEPVTKEHIRAAASIEGELKKELSAALDLETPNRLYVCPKRKAYIERLATDYDYDAATEMIIRTWGSAGQQAADDWLTLHQAGRSTMSNLAPVNTINTVMGPVVLPLDSISEGRWSLQVDVVEGSRLLHDFAAGALLKEEVDVFIAVFPRTYQELSMLLEDTLIDKKGAKGSYQPAPWLADSIRVFEREPFGATLKLGTPTLPVGTEKPVSSSSKVKLDTKILQTASQKVL